MQNVGVGDLFPWTPDAYDGFIVKAVEPKRMLFLGGDAGSLDRVTWAFVLESIDESHTRLLARVRGDYERPWVGLRLHRVAPSHPLGDPAKTTVNVQRRRGVDGLVADLAHENEDLA